MGEILKHKLDPSEYKMHRLKNGLQVLTISNTLSVSSSALIQANVGYADDPEEYDGLAHFLEHMLFMGSVKYPEPGHLVKILEKYNGERNADTDVKLTTYYITCDSEGFDEVIDVFLQFFIAPLMSEDGVNKEMNAVHAEYLKNINSNNWLIKRLFDIRSNSPWNKFGSGNLDTLDKPGIHTALLDLYKRYSANQMYVVLYHNSNNFDLALELLNQIPNHNIAKPEYPLLVYKPGLIITSPEGITDYIAVSWVLPVCEYIRKEYIYLQYMLNYPYENGLRDVLRRHRLITDMNVSLQSYIDVWTLTVYFTIDTRHSKSQLQQVLTSLYEFIDTIRESPEQTYMELRQIYKYRQIHYEVSFTGSVLHECREYISNMSEGTPDKYVVLRMELYEKYSEKYMQQMFSHIRHDNSVVVHSSSSHTKFNLRDELYRLDYSIMPHIELSMQKLGITLPPPNLYIIKPNKIITKFTNASTELVINTNGTHVWYQKYFNGGDIMCMFYIHFNTEQAPKNKRLEYLYEEMLNRLIDQDRHALMNASGNADISITQNIIRIVVIGLLQQIQLFLQRLSDMINNFVPVDFDQVNHITLDEYTNFNYDQPFDQLVTYLETAQSLNYLPQQLSNISITREEFIAYHQSFKHACQMKVTVVGIINQTDISNLCSKLSYYTADVKINSPKIKLVTDKISYTPTNINNVNSAYGAYYHYGEFRSPTVNYLYILIIQSIINVQFYDYLRTKKQLGYLLNMELDEIPHYDSFTVGFTIRVQSPSVSSLEIKKHVVMFLKSCYDNIQKVNIHQIFKSIDRLYSGPDLETTLNRIDSAIMLHGDFQIDKTFNKLKKQITVDKLKTIYYDLFLNPDTVQRTEVFI